MSRYKPIHIAVFLTFALIADWGCHKVVTGYLSDNIYYVENPFPVYRGVTTTSAILEGDGSTTPLQVKLLAVKNKLTGASADSMFLKPQVLKTFSDAITSNDSTVALLQAKLKDSLVAPFGIGSIGGRMQFSQGSLHIDTGMYSIDLLVSNVRGARTLPDVCDIHVMNPAEYQVVTAPYAYFQDTLTGARNYNVPAPDITVTSNPAGPDSVIFQWTDQNGLSFNPAAGEVIARTGLPTFRSWDPYYPQELGDSTITHRYPGDLNYFPVFASWGTFSNYICYYRIPGRYVTAGQHVHLAFALEFLDKGTHYVQIRLNGVTHI